VATASSNGSLHVWRVEYIPRPGGNPDRYTGTSGLPPPPPSHLLPSMHV